MPRVPWIKEWPIRYRTLSVVVMEPWEIVTNRTMKWPNVQVKLPMRVEPLEVKPKGWGDNAIKVTLANF
jgi:hypothetical protein